MSLLRALKRLTTTRRGQVALSLRSAPTTRTFLCRRCDRKVWAKVCRDIPAQPDVRTDITRRVLARSLGLTDARVWRVMDLVAKEIYG